MRIAGCVFACQWVFTCILKFAEGTPHELLWLSHVALLLSAVGGLLNRGLVIQTALVAVLGPHAVWLGDFFSSRVLGASPLAVTAYLTDAPWWVWVGTAHHFYLAPTLVWLVTRQDRLYRTALWMASILLLYLTVLSRAFLPVSSNVNYAFGLFSPAEPGLFDSLNRLPESAYLLVLNAGVTLMLFTPAAGLIALLSKPGKHKHPTRVPSVDVCG